MNIWYLNAPMKIYRIWIFLQSWYKSRIFCFMFRNLRTGKILSCSHWQVQGLNQTYPIVTKIKIKIFNKKMLWNVHDKKKFSLLEHLTWYPFDTLFVQLSEDLPG
jgi:hypothetical protein